MVTHDARADGPHLLVVIDHHEARIYSTEVHGAVPVKTRTLRPARARPTPALRQRRN